ncbi:anti-sigma factor family protein [Amycolatopsis vastitatis]|uniref:Anti-sigma factor n=1 Tax=Amycolatopsis vastitatis TaxID=1905142 RepID=A0A229T5D5_9PSEU|nr:zf-HC2 domain-containing protein [Amycolatopsis vastitatis]OXM66303.1 anti-sigma factor [Amycolatopsis vastitatis]
MNCDEFVELVTAFLDGALDPAAEERFIEHLALCEGCERYLEQFRTTIAELGELPPEPLSPAVRTDLLDAFRDWHRG